MFSMAPCPAAAAPAPASAISASGGCAPPSMAGFGSRARAGEEEGGAVVVVEFVAARFGRFRPLV
jgi:hypothetical protein